MSKNQLNKYLLLNHCFIEKIPFLNYYSEVQQTLKLLDSNEVSKFLYFQKSLINKILDIEDEIIEISSNKYDFKFYFYLTLLIEDYYDIVNYTYKYDFILQLNRENENENEKLKKTIISKILLSLIYNFRGFNGNKNLNKDLDNIEKNNLENIKNNMHILREFNMNINEDEIDEISLEEIYGEIISYLIKNKKLEDYDYSYNIIHQIEINSIDITEKMFNELSSLLNSKESFISDYFISNSEDLLESKNINFYFILFKYILKDSQKIYNFPLLLNLKKIIINSIKNSVNFNFDKIDNDIKERFEFNVKFILDSNYYYNLYLSKKNELNLDIKAILEYYKNYFFESKKNEINEIQNGTFNFQNHMEDINKAKIKNEKYNIIDFIFNYKYNEEEKTEDKIQNVVKLWEDLEKMIKHKKIKKMRKDNKIMLRLFFDDINNKDLLLKIFGEDSYEFFKKESSKIIKTLNKRDININALKEILDYYKTFLFESKARDINLIDNAIKTERIDINYEQYLKDLEIAKKMNIRFPLINDLFKVKSEEGKMIKPELEVKEEFQRYELIEMMIKNKEIKNMRRDDRNKIFNYFNDQKNKSVLLEIFDLDIYEFILKEYFDYINQNKKKILDNEIIIKLNEVLKYYKQYMPETKKEEIISIEDIIKNNSGKYEKYIKDYEIAKEMNLKTPLISLFGNLNDNENEINSTLDRWKSIEKMFIDKKYKKMRGEYRKKLINFFKNKNNKEIIIKIFNKELYDFFIEKNSIKAEEDNIQNVIISKNILKAKDGKIYDLENNSLNPPLYESFQKEQELDNSNIILTSNNNESFYQTKSFKSEKSEKEIKLKEYIKEKEEEIAELILKESKLRFLTQKNGEEMTFIYDQNIIVNKNMVVEYKELNNCREYFLKNKTETVLAKNFLKFMEFKNEFEDRIRNGFKYNYNLKMELAFQRVDNKERGNEFYDIQCKYNFYPPDNKYKDSFIDENILMNKTESNLQGFLYLLNIINNEKYNNC